MLVSLYGNDNNPNCPRWQYECYIPKSTDHRKNCQSICAVQNNIMARNLKKTSCVFYTVHYCCDCYFLNLLFCLFVSILLNSIYHFKLSWKQLHLSHISRFPVQLVQSCFCSEAKSSSAGLNRTVWKDKAKNEIFNIYFKQIKFIWPDKDSSSNIPLSRSLSPLTVNNSNRMCLLLNLIPLKAVSPNNRILFISSLYLNIDMIMIPHLAGKE